jgi:tRNA-splicing ligase RtcB
MRVARLRRRVGLGEECGYEQLRGADMYTTITTERVPIYVWGQIDDESTLAQTRNLANLPFAHHHVALMPDAHVGFGMPIGGVLAADGQVIPHAVGLDIGCGVRAWKTNVRLADLLPWRDRVLDDIQRSIPQGFEWHRSSQAERTDVFERVPDVGPLRAEIAKAERQAGTLGGGNHFLELQVDPDAVVWAMVHSGSRNVGKQMADYYDHVARAANEAEHSDVPLAWGLAHLPVEGAYGGEYLAVMNWCLDFARESRRLMAESMRVAIARYFPDVEPGDELDIHHNYAALEEHFGETVVVHRKGAVHAVGTILVPGSMGTSSYVCEGKADPDSFESCSHGAGRAMGRKQAVRTIPRERVLAELAERDIKLFKVKKGDVAEEAPEAYKDIEQVLAWERDLVQPRIRLTPVGVVKG